MVILVSLQLLHCFASVFEVSVGIKNLFFLGSLAFLLLGGLGLVDLRLLLFFSCSFFGLHSLFEGCIALSLTWFLSLGIVVMRMMCAFLVFTFLMSLFTLLRFLSLGLLRFLLF